MEICTTDIKKTIKYLSDSLKLYDRRSEQRYVGRAQMIRRLIKKLSKKLNTEENDKRGID